MTAFASHSAQQDQLSERHPAMTDSWTITIDKADIRAATAQPLALPALAHGQVRVHIDHFALTANNVTYALFGPPSGLFGPNETVGDQGYWDFFGDRDEAGTLPVWGFATVTDSIAEGIAVDDSFYGYYPMASDAVLTVGRAGPHGFTDATPRRTTLPPIYNQYQRFSALPDYRAEHHEYWPVFRPLFLTGWLIADQIEDEGDYGAGQVLIASASSKTAIGLGYCLRQRDRQPGAPRPRTIGLTSPGSVAALEATGIYDQVVAYDSIQTIDTSTPAVYVDMAGNADVTGRVHCHFADQLQASIVVGKSHWDSKGGFDVTDRLPGPPRQGFFAPARSQKRIADWGAAGFGQAIATAWLGFMDIAPALAKVDIRHGADGALSAYRELIAGTADPKAGIVIAA
jgi:Protein of unknown function (DUF2855)